MSVSKQFNPIQEYWLDAVATLDSLPRYSARARKHLSGAQRQVRRRMCCISRRNWCVTAARWSVRSTTRWFASFRPRAPRSIPTKAPIIVVDPRAGHGPGIGGMKQDSEIGVALAAGHACYFIGFLPNPMPGQTIEDVCRAEAIFVEDVAARHPDAEGKPMIIANCQAGWQIMMMAAINPDLTGSDHAGRLAAVLLGRRARQEPDALPGRRAGRHLADRAVRRPGQRHLRRRQSGGQLRVAEPRQHLLDQGLQRLFEGRYRERAVPRLRDLVGQPGPAERRGDAVDRRQPVRRQPAVDRPDPHLRRASASICATSRRRSSCSARGATTSRRRSRRWTGSSTSTTTSEEIVANGQTIVYTMHQTHRASRHLRVRQGRDQGARRVRHPAWR